MSCLDILQVHEPKRFPKNKHNSYGYRCNEFESYDWSDSILFLGCSHVYGMSNLNENTIPYLYSTISGNTAINMGICGGNPETILHNTFALIEKEFIPKQVAILWPEISRQLYYKGDKLGSRKRPLLLGNWSEKAEKALWQQHILYTENYMTKAYLIQKAVNNAWQLENTKVTNFTFRKKKLTQEGKILFPFTVLPAQVDEAQDGIHHGPKSNINYAKFIHKYL